MSAAPYAAAVATRIRSAGSACISFMEAAATAMGGENCAVTMPGDANILRTVSSTPTDNSIRPFAARRPISQALIGESNSAERADAAAIALAATGFSFPSALQRATCVSSKIGLIASPLLIVDGAHDVA